MLNQDTFKLQALLGPSITALGYELLGCVYIPRGHQSIVRIYIDSERGINIDDCEKVSRQVSAILDVEDPLPGAYLLEVSSPGEQRPLFTKQQFERFIGSRVQLTLHKPIENRRHYTGILCSVDEKGVMINHDQISSSILWTSIAKANLLPEIKNIDKARGKRQ